MSRIAIVLVLLVGVAVGLVAAEMGVFSGQSAADLACNGELSGSSWSADLNASTNLDSGTRVVCVHENGTRRNLTVNASINVEVSNS